MNDLQAPAANGGFGLTDTEGGMVTSVFIFSYMVFSPLFGYYGDRIARIPLLFCGIVGWSLAGLLASFATKYWQFLFMRSAIGIGEASFAVLAPSIIADLYSGTERTKVLALYCSSIPLGSAMGYIYAGEVARLLDWRWAFRITPFAGMLLAITMLLFVAEPARGSADGLAGPNGSTLSGPGISASGGMPKTIERGNGFAAFWRDTREIWAIPSFFWSTFGAIGMTFTAGSLAQWAPAFLQRANCVMSDAVCESKITRIFGIITIITGVFGSFAGASLAKAYARRDPAADAIVSGISLLLATPCVFASIYLSRISYELTWVFIFLGEFFVSLLWPLLTTIQLSVVHPELRNTAGSLALLMMHLLGDSISPVLIGVVADRLHDNGNGLSRANALQHSLYLPVTTTVIGGFCFLTCGRYLVADRASIFGTLQRDRAEINSRHERHIYELARDESNEENGIGNHGNNGNNAAEFNGRVVQRSPVLTGTTTSIE